jgi:hypothetical protein
MALPGVVQLRNGKIIEGRWFLEERDAFEAPAFRSSHCFLLLVRQATASGGGDTHRVEEV